MPVIDERAEIAIQTIILATDFFPSFREGNCLCEGLGSPLWFDCGIDPCD